jgi:quercetin dioxygenase-like cupin family protein
VFRLTPAPNRIACRIIAIRPEQSGPLSAEQEQEWRSRFDYAEMELLPDDPRFMHRTPTIDVIVVISGEVELVLDGGDVVRLQPGDSVIQRGTMHAWRCHGTEPCVAVAFMVRAE